MSRKLSNMGSSKYEFDSSQLDKDIEKRNQRTATIKEEILELVLENGSLHNNFSRIIRILKEIKEELEI
jgi:hypothetical protein